MKNIHHQVLLVLSTGLCFACASTDSGVPSSGGTTGGSVGGSAGSATTGGSSGSATAGASATGGIGATGGGLGGSAGVTTGGTAPGGAGAGGASAGAAGEGGGIGGDAGSMSGGSGGEPMAGMAGMAGGAAAGMGGDAGGGAGGAGGKSGATPSAGCGKGGRPSGGVVTVTNDHIYTFPASYDGSQPFPLLIGLHAAGNPIDQIRTLTNGSNFETNYVRAFPKSAGSAWDYNTDINKILTMYDDLIANYCVDTSRVFGTGHSSGAQMLVQILVRQSPTEHLNFKAVAPVAASNYGAIIRPIPVMYIQGTMDTQRGNSNGADVVARFTTANGCGMPSMAYPGVAGCTSMNVSVNPGCVSYPGCSEPTVWCSHNDPQYSNTNHGWPCFGTRAIYDFFESLP